MKKKKIIFPILFSILFVGCDKAPIESEQYKKLVYLVGAQNTTQSIELAYSNDPVETFVSVSTSGSLPIDKDVIVSLSSPANIISEYNAKYYEDDQVDLFLRPLKTDLYDLPNKGNLVIKSNEAIYARQVIKVHTADLHPDSIHAIPIQIDQISTFELNQNLKKLILTLKLKNKFSGTYGMVGTRKNLTSNAVSNLQKNKLLKAVGVNKLRMYVSDVSEIALTRETETVMLDFHADNSVVVSSWNKLLEVSGSGLYDPITKTVELKYSYQLNGVKYQVNEKLTFTN